MRSLGPGYPHARADELNAVRTRNFGILLALKLPPHAHSSCYTLVFLQKITFSPSLRGVRTISSARHLKRGGQKER